jgi:hypothetical protein
MGGMQDGAACATLTISALFHSLIRQTFNRSRTDGRSLLSSATLEANLAVFEKWKGKGGATLSAVLIEPGRSTCIVNVGDSRIYGFDDNHSRVVRLTVDDNLKDSFGGDDSRLVQFMGIGSAILQKVAQVPQDLNRLIMTSDGTHYVDQQIFKTVVEQADDAQRAAERLLALARWLGGPDNASIAAIDIAGAQNFLKTPQPEPAKIWSGQAQLSLMQYFAPDARSGGGGDGPIGGGPSDQVSGTLGSLSSGESGYVPPKDIEGPQPGARKAKAKRKSKTGKKDDFSDQLEITISGRDEDDDASHS